MNDELLGVRGDIACARQWARKHFNAYVDEETTPSHLLAPPTMFVDFPEPDGMIVSLVLYGKSDVTTAAVYKLCWKGEHGLVWKGNLLLRKELFDEGNIIELRVI